MLGPMDGELAAVLCIVLLVLMLGWLRHDKVQKEKLDKRISMVLNSHMENIKHNHTDLSNVVMRERYTDENGNVVFAKWCQGCGDELETWYAE